METKKNILMVHNFYQIGGGEHTVFENEKRLLRTHGHFVAEYQRSNEELLHSGLKKLLLPFTAVFSLRTYREVKTCIRRDKIDLVHCQNTFPLISPAVYYAAWSCHVPVVQTIHNYRFLCPNGLLFRKGKICEDCVCRGLGQALKQGCYRGSRLETGVVVLMLKIHRLLGTYGRLNYIFLTDFMRKKFRPLLGDKQSGIFLKPNFTEPVTAEPGERDWNRFLFASRLEESKGILFLLQVWKQVKDRDLVIYGTGPLEETVQKAAAENPRIHWKGFCPRQEIFQDLERSAALIFPSLWYEGFPMVITEAMALGRPVLCSDLGNGADLIKQNRAGLCYRPDEAADFLEKLELLTDPEQNGRLGARGRAAWEEKYAPEENYRILKQIYDEVCREDGKG